MADGRIVIDVIMDDGSIKQGVANIDSVGKAGDRAGISLKNMVGAGLLIKGVSAAMGVLKSSVGSAVERFDTLQKFPKVMESLGFNTDQSAKASKRLSDGIDGLPTTLQEVVANTQRMTAITGDLDKSTDATIAMNNAFLASGASTDAASRGMDQYMKMVSTGVVGLDSWTTLQETMPLALQKTAEAMGFVGKTAQNDLYSALKNGTVTFDEFQDKLIELGTGTGQLADLAKKNSLGIGTSFKNLQSSITKGVANVLTKFDEIIQKLSGKSIAQNIDSLKGIINNTFAAIISSMDKMLPVIEGVRKAFSTIAPFIKPLLPIIGALTAGIVTFVAVSATMSKVSGIFNAIKSSFTALKVAMMANPFALVVTGILALIAVSVHFYKTSEGFRNTVDSLFKSLKNLISPIDEIMNSLKALANGFKAIFSSDWSVNVAELKKEFTKVFPESLWNGMTKLANGLKAVIEGVKILTSAFKAIAFNDWSVSVSELHDKFVELLPESLWNAMTRLANGFKILLENIKSGKGSIDIFNITFKVLKSIFLTMLGPIGLVIKAIELFAKALGGGDINKGLDTIMQSFDGLTKGVQQNAPKLGKSFGQALEGILKAIGNALPGIIAGGLQIISGLLIGLAKGLPMLAIAAAELIAAFTGAMLVLIPTIILSATTIIVAFLGALTSALPQIIEAGGKLIQAILQGIIDQSPMLIESASNLIVTWLTALTTHLPEILQAGFDFLIAFLKGIADNIGQVTQQALNIVLNFVQVIISNMPKIVNAAVDLVVNFANGLASRMGDIITAAANLIASFVNGIANNLGQIINAAVNLIIKFLDGIAKKIPDIVNAAMGLVDAMIKGVVQAQGRLMDAAINLINGFANNIRGRQEDIRSAALNLLDAIIGVFVPDALFDAGTAIIDGFLNGLKSAFEGVKNFVGGIADWIAENKGPLPYDRRLLIPAGTAIMGGFNSSLEKGFLGVKKNVSSMANRLASDMDMGIGTLDIPNNFSLPKITAESALGISKRMGAIPNKVSNYYTTNNKTSGELGTPTFNFYLQEANLSNDRGIEDTSKQLAILTEKQLRGRLQ